ncbi:pesticidial crystal protein [Bacillus thuringiensis]|uniref:pesticidial crystal protein n=1 Tax=Bacillus thuringiensis TaxID=1428 RepID=UPI001CCBEF78|nr:pesticidial crystal protein [Bacillus thuringiensis]AXY95014.1 Cry54Ab-like protein [Bacillus thuringiensis]MBZ8125721.1 pesticidial crystal protein [Bacillus thuringiensis]
MFTSGTKNTLKIETTDYEIDQVAISIECMSDENSPKEKMMLWDEVKHAKYLSHSRNLLQNGDFEDSFNGWSTSNNISIQNNNSTFKGQYLNMYGARDIDGTLFPTYIYQKIDESKLKPYTRYQIRGFVGSSKDLKLMVIRYGKEIDAIMNVPNDISYVPSMPSCNELYNSEQSLYQNRNVGYYNLMPEYTSNTYQCISDQKQVICHDSHQFKFHIDTGELDYNTNLGMLILFKISSPDGYATLDNLEVIEAGPLTDEVLTHVKRKEKKWNQQMEKKRLETQQAYAPAKQAVDALFTNAQGEELHYHTTLGHIQNADQLAQLIPYVHHGWLPDVPGMNYDVYTDLNTRITQANYLYNARNSITNGDFTQGLTGWHATGKVDVQQIDGASILVLSNWSAGVSQNLHAQDHHGYMLRVIAKKEGPGKGYVTMMDCNGKQETLKFTSCEEEYMTKTVEVFPESDRVRIEIGETEGTFYIQSIELLCIK